MKKWGFIRVNPSDYVIVFQKGKIVKEGRGLSFFKWMSTQYVIIPALVSNIPFIADRVTIENQGVEVSGFAIWKIDNPSKAYLHFNFSDETNPAEKISLFLREVVESAIRHMVANMTIEDVLRKRGTIILQLKNELEYISTQWGIAIETIEIKNVKILSSQLFSNMQDKYRNAIRMESETSTLKTEQEITEQRLMQKGKLGLLEQESKRLESERKKEMDTLLLKQKSELIRLNIDEAKNEKMLQIDNELELYEKQEDNKRKTAELQLETILAEKELEKAKLEIEMTKKETEMTFKKMDIDIEREKIKLLNIEDTQKILYKNLPEIAQAFKINELNIGTDDIHKFIDAVSKKFISK